jgi:putative bacteriocin precursor
MKNLKKRNDIAMNTIEAFACYCSTCICSCSCITVDATASSQTNLSINHSARNTLLRLV